MNNIRVDIRLRPIRFGFLVRPDDAEKVLEIFRINTCLWGGIFNPIIPLFESVPSWMEEEGFRFDNPKQIINCYLDFFEPDFLVEAEEGLAEEFGFDPKRVLPLTGILERPGEGYWNTHSLSVRDLYSELYQKEFRFELRHQRNIVHVEAKESVFAGFVAANFGSFPAQENLSYFEHNYRDVFDPGHIALDATALLKLYQSEYRSALEIGCEKLRIDYNEFSSPMLFILDTQKSKDLIDFWNLRAIHQHVLAVPIQWIKELSPLCKEIIPARDVLTSFSPSISENDRENIHSSYLRIDEGNVYMPQIGYPPIWRDDRTTRPTLEANKKSMDIQIDEDNPEIRFDPLFPEFAGNRLRVANIIKLQDWNYRNQIATVFPCNYKNPTLPTFGFGRKYLLSTTEGLVIFPEHKNLSEDWNLIDGTTAFNQWFKANQVPATPSDAGRATQQIIQTLGGFGGVGHLARKGVIELLNEMSGNSATKTTHYKEFKNKIHAAVDNESSRKRTFETLVERKVVELGLELKCSKCSKWSWYSVNQLDYSLICNFCFKQFNFPITNPIGEHSRWAYRVVGPFALPKYADGGYATALAIRFFADVIGRVDGSKVTWSSGQKLMLPTSEKVEVDFMLWYQREGNFETNYPTETVFGEAKSFGRRGEDVFEQNDVNRMKLLAEAFPGSILVFATMKEELSQEEINRIKELAEWGREYDQDREQTRAPVIVLTGTELFTEMFFEESWEERGRHKHLIQAWKGNNNLRVWADRTQQLYLGMPPYESSRPIGGTTWLPAGSSAKQPEKV